MKIIINTAHQRFGGGVQVALSFIYECRKFHKHEYHVFVGPGVEKSLNEKEFSDNFSFYPFDFGVIDMLTARHINKALRKAEQEIDPDVIISTTGPTYFHSEAPQIIGYNLGLYIYGESPFMQEMSFQKKLKLWLRKKVHFYFFKRDAVAYVTQTDDVNQRVQSALNTKNVHTVTNTCNDFYRNWKSFSNKVPDGKNNPFRFLTLSSYYSHKNLELILKVLDELTGRGIEGVEFVLTLKEEDFRKHIGDHPKIHNVGPVKPEECPSLYAECDGMFLPTLAECFSASYPEAMIMEKPIVTTDLGFARSICGEAALYFEPKNAKVAADQIEKLMGDKELQKALIQNGLTQLKTFDTPEERARKYLELCEQYAK